jgi:hypothetical protein
VGTDGRRQSRKKELALAQRILARALEGNQRPEGLPAATNRALSQLYQRLEPLVGPAGYEALLRRALYLARAESPFLQSVTVATSLDDVRLEGLQASVRGQDSAVIHQGLVAVLANFIWLLVTFFGEELALHIVRQAWPEEAPGSAGFGPKENDA